MWINKFWTSSYWTNRFWSHATPGEPCLPVDAAIRFRYGTGRHWGTGWKWGGGNVVDPYLPICGDPCTVHRFELDHSDQEATFAYLEGSLLLWIDSSNVLRARTGLVDEHYYLQDPVGQWWHVVVSAVSGSITRVIVSAPSGRIGMVVVSESGVPWTFSITSGGALLRQAGSSVVYVTDPISDAPIFTEESC